MFHELILIDQYLCLLKEFAKLIYDILIFFDPENFVYQMHRILLFLISIDFYQNLIQDNYEPFTELIVDTQFHLSYWKGL